jgi:hypothetical protein
MAVDLGDDTPALKAGLKKPASRASMWRRQGRLAGVGMPWTCRQRSSASNGRHRCRSKWRT